MLECEGWKSLIRLNSDHKQRKRSKDIKTQQKSLFKVLMNIFEYLCFNLNIFFYLIAFRLASFIKKNMFFETAFESLSIFHCSFIKKKPWIKCCQLKSSKKGEK